MDRSWVNEKSFFPLILCFIFLLHLSGFFITLTFSPKDPPKPKPHVIKVYRLPFDLKKQIVESADSDQRDIVEDAYMSDKTRSFDRQTRARKTDPYYHGDPTQSAGKKSQPKMKLSDLGMIAEDPYKTAAKEYTKQKNDNALGKGQPDRKVSSTSDYLEEIPPGDMTQLNTVEYKYYGFYYRIKQRLEQFWGRTLHEKAAQLTSDGRRLPTSEELITALQITLDDNGEIIAIKVMGSSGIQELDDAAIDSFNEAGPFPNPPQGLIVDGKVTLEWGFVVKS